MGHCEKLCVDTWAYISYSVVIDILLRVRQVCASLQGGTSGSLFYFGFSKAEWIFAGHEDDMQGRDPADGGMAGTRLKAGHCGVRTVATQPALGFLPMFSTPIPHPAHSHPFLSNKYLW